MEQLDKVTGELEDATDRLAQTDELTKELRECRRKCDELEEDEEELKSIVDELEDANAKLKEELRRAFQFGQEMEGLKDDAERELEALRRGEGSGNESPTTRN